MDEMLRLISFFRAPGVDSIEGYKVYGHCIPGCSSYAFDDSFWQVSDFLGNRAVN